LGARLLMLQIIDEIIVHLIAAKLQRTASPYIELD
jgi:hypothetical protein